MDSQRREELSGQSEQYCFELFVVCLRDILKARILSLERRELQQSRHERRKAEARVFVAFVDRWWKNGTNATEIKISWAYQNGDVSFHGQVTIKCNNKVFEKVRHGNRCTTYNGRVWEGRRERSRLSTRGYSHCFGLVIFKFMHVHCHSSHNVINTLLHGEKIWDLMRGCSFVIGVWCPVNYTGSPEDDQTLS